jgi:hypothetical protein
LTAPGCSRAWSEPANGSGQAGSWSCAGRSARQ